MKRYFLVVCMLLVVLASEATPKTAERIDYIFKQLKLSVDQQKKLKPFLQAYFTDIQANKKHHDDLKDKYKSAEKSNKLTDAQAEELMQSKFTKDEKELATKRQFYTRFKTVVGAAKARRIMDLSNDKIKRGDK